MTSVAVEAMPSHERYFALLAVVESLRHGVVVYDDRGGVLHQNACLKKLYKDEPEHEALASAVDRVRCETSDARRHYLVLPRTLDGAHGATARCEVLVRTARGEYDVNGWLARPSPSARVMIVVAVRPRAGTRRLSAHELERRFRLTRAEVRVAGLIDAGRRTREIAGDLGISIHTVRRHAESVLKKLGVHSRTAVSARLRE